MQVNIDLQTFLRVNFYFRANSFTYKFTCFCSAIRIKNKKDILNRLVALSTFTEMVSTF